MNHLQQRGFGLVELMVVVAIIAILSAIGYPMYLEHKVKSSRADAHTGLSKAAQAQERYFTDNDTYAATITALRGFDNDQTEHGLYTLSVECPAGCANGFVLVATPNFTNDKDDCRTLTLTSTGEKNNRGPGGTTDTPRCW